MGEAPVKPREPQAITNVSVETGLAPSRPSSSQRRETGKAASLRDIEDRSETPVPENAECLQCPIPASLDRDPEARRTGCTYAWRRRRSAPPSRRAKRRCPGFLTFWRRL